MTIELKRVLKLNNTVKFKRNLDLNICVSLRHSGQLVRHRQGVERHLQHHRRPIRHILRLQSWQRRLHRIRSVRSLPWSVNK